eukprot:CAMPEP_0115036344 /NCGR_PEP_ID=MMETSP0216-20121206/42064_1 /TAXON_ID=223996 /ORGANISM="Protocruzia adherens, Strain Boccale" /LENGTH=169 /DNA_ID=CAMNT_0002416149 /DNA_START=46 /DNA_END=555 /DNA_ORIENTATION=-
MVLMVVEGMRTLAQESTYVYDGHAAFWGFLGVGTAIMFANLGAAYGTAKSGVGIVSVGSMKPEKIMKCLIPTVMAGIIGVYGLIVAVILQNNISAHDYDYFKGYKHAASGLACGLSGLAAGLSIGIAGDAGVRATGQNERVFVGMILILIFAEALALYGLIVSLILSSN